jgi:hypothetical protein
MKKCLKRIKINCVQSVHYRAAPLRPGFCHHSLNPKKMVICVGFPIWELNKHIEHKIDTCLRYKISLAIDTGISILLSWIYPCSIILLNSMNSTKSCVHFAQTIVAISFQWVSLYGPKHFTRNMEGLFRSFDEADICIYISDIGVSPTSSQSLSFVTQDTYCS